MTGPSDRYEEYAAMDSLERILGDAPETPTEEPRPEVATPVPSVDAAKIVDDGRRRRFAAVIVAVVIVAAIVADWSNGGGPPTSGLGASAPVALASLAAPSGSESSTWYCAGGTGPTSATGNGNQTDQATLYLVNSSAHEVAGTITVANSTGKSALATVGVPRDGQTTFVPSSVLGGTWLASTLTLEGGGVSVSQTVSGPNGWSSAPCASVTSTTWYFPHAETSNGSIAFLALYNPTVTPAVVDTTFLSQGAALQPPPDEGVIVAPGTLFVEPMAQDISGRSSIASLVDARAGEIVATELEVHENPTGLSLTMGSPGTSMTWTIPFSYNPPGGSVGLSILNPTSTTEHVKVSVRIPSGPVTPIPETVGPQSVKEVSLTGQTSIPLATPYQTVVSATGAAGVVVSEEVGGSAHASAPAWGSSLGVSAATASAPGSTWGFADPLDAETGASIGSLAMSNMGKADERVTIEELAHRSLRPVPGIPTITLKPSSFFIESSKLHVAAGNPLLVVSTGPLAAVAQATPAGAIGVVTVLGVPRSPAP